MTCVPKIPLWEAVDPCIRVSETFAVLLIRMPSPVEF